MAAWQKAKSLEGRGLNTYIQAHSQQKWSFGSVRAWKRFYWSFGRTLKQTYFYIFQTLHCAIECTLEAKTKVLWHYYSAAKPLREQAKVQVQLYLSHVIIEDIITVKCVSVSSSNCVIIKISVKYNKNKNK